MNQSINQSIEREREREREKRYANVALDFPVVSLFVSLENNTQSLSLSLSLFSPLRGLVSRTVGVVNNNDNNDNDNNNNTALRWVLKEQRERERNFMKGVLVVSFWSTQIRVFPE